MKDYWVELYTPARFVTVKGKRVRTPTSFKIPESELNSLRVMIRYESITEYKITEFEQYKLKKMEDSSVEDTFIENNEVIIEHVFEDEPKTTLEKLLKASEMEKENEVDTSNN
jgi:hypothetical protein